LGFRSNIPKNADECATLRQPFYKVAHLIRFSAELGQKRDVCSALFRSHAHAAEQKWSKKAYLG
jgi:hypothetical protein